MVEVGALVRLQVNIANQLSIGKKSLSAHRAYLESLGIKERDTAELGAHDKIALVSGGCDLEARVRRRLVLEDLRIHNLLEWLASVE